MTTTPSWIGTFAELKEPGPPGCGPEGIVTYPEGIGGFVVRSDDDAKPVVRLRHFYSKSNHHFAEHGDVSFQVEDLHLGGATV